MGYQVDFLGGGVNAPLPRFSPELFGDLVRADGLENDIYAHYPNYTVVMNRKRSSPVYAAQNVLQGAPFYSSKDRDWKVDTRIYDRQRPTETYHQLNNDYYRDTDIENPWDRGHMAMRATSAWGLSQHEADRNSRETYYWTNSVLQHKHVNRDEWVGIENWTRALKEDNNNRICVISGPIYHVINLYVEPSGRLPAAIPSAFFKVVMFRHRNTPDQLAVRAFILPQDAVRMRARGEWKPEALQKYQVPIRLIERLSGLEFHPDVISANPVFDTPSELAKDLGVQRFPEVNEVDDAQDILDPGQLRPVIRDREVAVSILAAMVKPKPVAGSEWVSLVNYSDKTVKLNGWSLKDTKGRVAQLSGSLKSAEAARIQNLGAMRLANDKSGSLTLLNQKGERIDRVSYTELEAKTPDKPIIFRDSGRFDI